MAIEKRHEYREVAEIRTDSGLVASITAREAHGGGETFAFAIRKEYERGGETKQTSWLQRHHFVELRDLINRVEAVIVAAEDKSREAVRRKHSSP